MSGMTVYFARRLLLVPVTFLAITFMVYAILRVVPGGPIEQAQARRRLASRGEAGGAGGGLVGQETGLQIDEDAMKELERFYALDRPIPVGYLQWLGLWPRERLRLVPGVPAEEHRETFDRLTRFRQAAADARTALSAHLAERELVSREGRLWKPVAEDAVPEELRHRAALLEQRTFGERFELRDALAARGFALADGEWLAAAEPVAGDPWFDRASALLAAAGDAEKALVSTEEATGYVLTDEDRLLQRAFEPLVALKRVEIEAGERLAEILDEKGLVAYGGDLYRLLTDAERDAEGEFFREMDDLAAQGFGKRDRLLERLAARGFTWRANAYFVRVTPAEESADPEWFETARAVLAARLAATGKLAEIRAAQHIEVTDQLGLKRVERRLSGILELDFGRSYTYSEPVLHVIGSKMEVSIQFGLIGYILAWVVCVPLGVFKAIKHRSAFDNVTSMLVFLGYAVPGFIVALVLLSTVAGPLGLPLGGYKPANIDELGWLDSVLGRMRHMLIPVIGYMVGSFATMTILMKNSLMENLGQDYVRTAFAKGLSERRVIFVHALRNSMIPITAGIGHALALLFAGSFLIEKTCNIDGMGLLGYQSIVERDYPIILGLLVFLVLIQLFGNIISDIVWAIIDPRIRFGS